MAELPNQLAWLLGVFYFTLLESDVKEDDVRNQFGLSLDQLINLEAPVSIDQYKHLGKIAQTLTNRPDIGLKLGKDAEIDEDKGGVVLNIALNSPTIRDLVQELVKLSTLFKDILTFNMYEMENTVEISMDFFKAGDMGIPLTEFYVSGFIATLRHIIGDEFRPKQINFPYPAPHYSDAYKDAFKTRVMFNQETTSFTFDKKYMERPTPKPVAIVKEILSQVVDSHIKELNENALFQTRVRKLIVQRLPSGDVGIESIARDLRLNRGLIYRKLKEENTSYKHLLTSTRQQLARQYLKNPSLTIDTIASHLGYTESSAFKRAFKNWFGINPGQYRKQCPPSM